MFAPCNWEIDSFCLHFRFVRAGEAKLHGPMTIVVLIAGPPGWEYSGVCAWFFASYLVLIAWFKILLVFLYASSWLSAVIHLVLGTCRVFVRQYITWWR